MSIEIPRKRVLFMLPLLNVGGAERVLTLLANNINRDKYEPIFVILGDKGKAHHWINSDMPIYCLNKSSVSKSILSFFKLLRQLKPDIAVTTMVHSNALLSLMAPIFPKTRFIIRESSTPTALLNEHYGLKGKINLYVYKYLYPMADLVISPAQTIVDEFKNTLNITMKSHKTLYNPVDVQKIRTSLPNNFDVTKSSRVYFIAAGRLSYEKGFDRLIESLTHSNLTFDWQLDIFGAGKEGGTLQKLIINANLEENIFLKGHSDNIWSSVAKADLFLLPSRWEGMPNATLEALACGTNVLSIKEAGGIIDINKMTSDDTVKLVETMDEFINTMKNTKPLRKTSPLKSLLPKDFNLKQVVKKFESMIDD